MLRPMASPILKHYGVYWVNLDPTQGRELRKTRPAVVISQDELNAILDTVVICPLTSFLHPTRRTRLQITLNHRPSEIAIDQIRVVSKDRLSLEKIGDLSPKAQQSLRELLHGAYCA